MPTLKYPFMIASGFDNGRGAAHCLVELGRTINKGQEESCDNWRHYARKGSSVPAVQRAASLSG